MPSYCIMATAVVCLNLKSIFKTTWISLRNLSLCLERITQSVLKSHIETSQYSTEELKRMAWTLYSPEETSSYQTKVYMTHFCIANI